MGSSFNEVSAYDLVQYKNQKWMFLADKNAICYVDDKENTIVNIINNEECILQKDLYQCSLKVGDKIVFVPFAAKELLILDLLSKKLKKIDIELPLTFQRYNDVSFKYKLTRP